MLPKAELHLHLEGTIFHARARELVAKHRGNLPKNIFDRFS